ncbi:MAG TPA: hypothetical protein VJP77_01430, partial [Planctomycetota bacterium]|nr:hypothetical protein [Planctomycetota bacterium]
EPAAQESEVPPLLEPALADVVGDEPFTEPVDGPPVVEPPVLEPDPRGPGWTTSVTPFASAFGRADFKYSPGSLQLYRAGVDFDALRRDDNGHELVLQARYEASKYDFEAATGLVQFSDRPIEDVHRLRLGALWRNDPVARWSAQAAFALNVAGEADADLADSTYFAGGVQLTHRLKPELAFVGGAYVTQQFEDDPFFLPIFGVQWEFGERTRLQTIGPAYELSHDLWRDVRVFARAGYEQRQFRLDEDGAAPGGAFRDREINLYTGLDWNPGLDWGFLEGARFRLLLGGNAYRRFYFYGDDDDRISADEAHGAFFAGLLFQLRL